MLAWMLRRRWAMTAVRQAARLKLARLEYVGRGAVAAAARRARAEGAAASVRRAAYRGVHRPWVTPALGRRAL